MASVDIAALSAPIAGEDPCGPNLEYDAAFAELERISQGRPEQQIGDTVVKAEEPEWRAVDEKARTLLTRTKDLRVGVTLTRALMRVQGWEGFAAGLESLRRSLVETWEGVHPRLDPDDDNDPTARLNVLAGLADAPTIAGVRAMPLVSSRAMGRFGLREIDVALGEAQPSGDEASSLTLGVLEGAIAEVDLEALTATANAVSASVAALAAIEAAFTEKSSQQLSLGRLPALVKKAETFISARVAARQPAGAEAAAAAPASNGTPAASFARPGGEIGSREDVIRTLDRVLAYYARHEPSSPIPLLIERSKKLVAMSFFDIIRELAPDGVSQIETLRGRTE
jgi:type VI secretion system protein ImpA